MIKNRITIINTTLIMLLNFSTLVFAENLLDNTIEKLENDKILANVNSARVNLLALSLGAESCAHSNNGAYPISVEQLGEFSSSAPSLCGNTVMGYHYTCELSASGYKFTATPTEKGGITTLIVTTGRVFTPSQIPELEKGDAKQTRDVE